MEGYPVVVTAHISKAAPVQSAQNASGFQGVLTAQSNHQPETPRTNPRAITMPRPFGEVLSILTMDPAPYVGRLMN